MSAPMPPGSTRPARTAPAAVYVATDAPALLKAPCVGACFRAHTWADFAAAAAARAPDAVTRGEAQGCMPYWVTAVEQEVLLNARSVVLSETSNFARTVAVERRRRRGPFFLEELGVAASQEALAVVAARHRFAVASLGAEASPRDLCSLALDVCSLFVAKKGLALQLAICPSQLYVSAQAVQRLHAGPFASARSPSVPAIRPFTLWARRRASVH